MKEFFLASNNAHKLYEFKLALPDISIKTPSDLGLDFNPVENGTSFLENALIKARTLYKLVHQPILADDSGLCVEALNGAPGIHSARYASLKNTSKSSPANTSAISSGSNQGDLTNTEYLLENLAGVTMRKAFFVACIVLYFDENRFYVVQETCEGEIAKTSAGSGGFGYDPVFFLPAFQKTMAELRETEKNRISHRGKALSALRKILQAM